MCGKRGQTWSLETYLSIAIFLIAIIFFYSLTTINSSESNIAIEVEQIGKSLAATSELRDSQLTESELEYLLSLGCDDLKRMYKTDKDICIYLKDADDSLLLNASGATIYGIGCPSINVSGKPCGTVE